MHRFEDWQRPRQYPTYLIEGLKKCHYFLMNFECGVAELEELKKKLDYNDHKLRYLITRRNKAITEPSKMLQSLKNQSYNRERRTSGYHNKDAAMAVKEGES